MDFNHNNQNNPNHNGNWDRWDSNASNSSYYNQPTHKPYGQGFLTASCLCGFLSVTMCCTGALSLPIGALGILFALLAYRKGKKLASQAVVGIVLSTVGMLSGIALIIYSFVTLPEMLQNEAFRSQVDTVTEQMYGMDFAEFMEEFYGYTIEE